MVFYDAPIIVSSYITDVGWQVVDISPLGLPNVMTGWIIELQNFSGSSITVGWRNEGTSDTPTGTLPAGSRTFAFVNGRNVAFEIYNISTFSLAVALYGYFESTDIEWKSGDNETLTPGAASTWETDTLTGMPTETAPSAAIVIFTGALATYRLPGSSWSPSGGTGGITGAIIPVSSAQIQYQTLGEAIQILGYLREKQARWDTTVGEYGQTELNAWYDHYPQGQPASGSWALAASLHAPAQSQIGIRPNGGSPIIETSVSPSYGGSGASMFVLVPFDLGGPVEVKYENASAYLSQIGFVRLDPAPPLSLSNVERGRAMARGFARGSR